MNNTIISRDARSEKDQSTAGASCGIAPNTAAPNSTKSSMPSASSTIQDTAKQKHPMVTTRIGALFIISAVSTLGCALISHATPGAAALHSVLWVAAVAVCSLAAMVSMRSVRTLQTIESELHRVTGQPEQWKSARPIIGNDPITDGWNELLHEVSRSHQTEIPDRSTAALNQEVVTLARAMRGLPVSWVITDREGRVRQISSPACGLFGISDEEHVGRDLPVLLGLRDNQDENATDILNRLLSDLRMVRERISITIGSRTLHVQIRRSILEGRSGDGQGLAWIIDDVTQQQIATKARDQFLMTATHELRTPLNNLQAYAEALQEEDDLEVDKQREFCNVIVSESHRLGRLVDQLLTVGQMEAGSMVANRHELEMLPMVEYATEQMIAMAAKKEQKLLTDFAPKLPTIFGDRDKLQAALVNLVGNAVKYTPNGGEVIVRSGVDGDFVRIDIQDNGPGIAPEEQAKVFDKFYRGSNATDSDERGNGLGLAFTREVVRMHGGEVELESKIGEGSTFTVRLPIGGQSRSGI